jgi:hypothetical protein
MPNFRCELFGHFIFAEELSYAELLEKETRIKENLSDLFSGAGFAHVHFTPIGDFLLVQGVAVEHDQEVFQEVCEEVSQLLDEDVEARLLFVDRFLHSVFFYLLNSETWQETFLEWPLPKNMLTRGTARPDAPSPASRQRNRGAQKAES